MPENEKLDKSILFPYLKSRILEKIVSDEFLITSQDKKKYKKVQDKSKKCEESIKTTLSEVKFSELKNKILEDLNKQHVKKYIRGHRELFIDKIEGRLPDGAADLGLLIQIFDRERVIERAFISTLIFLKHDFTDKYYSSFLKSKIEKNNITDEDILNFYKDQRTRTGLSDGYLRQYIKTLLETNFIHL